jgi:hypothetical protein
LNGRKRVSNNTNKLIKEGRKIQMDKKGDSTGKEGRKIV